MRFVLHPTRDPVGSARWWNQVSDDQVSDNRGRRQWD
jgi:hypothetical protein